MRSKKGGNLKYMMREKYHAFKQKYGSNDEFIQFCIGSILSFIILSYVCKLSIVPSTSMLPNIQVGDIMISCGFDAKNINRYDVVIFKKEGHLFDFVVKRVIGLPGDKIEIKNGELYINDSYVQEDYILNKMTSLDDNVYIVPNDSYFLLGDNRDDSLDSRFWDNPYLSSDRIYSKVKYIISYKNRSITKLY